LGGSGNLTGAALGYGLKSSSSLSSSAPAKRLETFLAGSSLACGGTTEVFGFYNGAGLTSGIGLVSNVFYY
jgi:hypothetical protein